MLLASSSCSSFPNSQKKNDVSIREGLGILLQLASAPVLEEKGPPLQISTALTLAAKYVGI